MHAIRVAVAASGVHLLYTTLRRGEPGPLPPPGLPTVPGREVAGVVDLVEADDLPGLAGRALDELAVGSWRPLVSAYPLSGAATAHADLEGRATAGKVVLLTDQASEIRSA